MASITDHVIKLQELTQKNLDILQALNDSFFTNQNHLSVRVGEQQYAIPSFIALENKINSLAANFENLVNAPETGEAFFDFNGNSRAINVRSYTSTPNSLVLNPVSEFKIEQNDIFKDFLTPNPYIKLDVKSLPNDTTQVIVKKVIPLNSELKQLFKSYLVKVEGDKTIYSPSVQYSYKDLYKILDSYKQDVDYIEYDTRMDMPIRKNVGAGTYVIEEVIEDVVDENLDNFITIKFRSDVNDPTIMNSLKYRLFDETIEKMLKVGDQLVTYEGNAKMEIIEVRTQTNTLKVKVLHGEFLNLVAANTNNMLYISPLSKVKFYSPIDFDEDKYINVPLEEDQYIFVSVAALNSRMNVQAPWGSGLIINSYILKDERNKDFKTYYDENVRNVGDVLFEITSMMSNTLTKYSKEEYDEFTQLSPIIDTNNIQVVRINNHLNNSTTIKNIRSWYDQKMKLNDELNTIQNNINDANSQLSSISFDDVTGNRERLSDEVSQYTAKKNDILTTITKLSNEIANAANNSEVPIENAKYRVRGFFDTSNLKHSDHIKGIRVQYRYKNAETSQNQALTINDKFVFTDWNEMASTDRQRIPVYSDGIYKSMIEPKTDNLNEPSFNQIDIPITQGETVDIRLKVVYDFGAPFVTTTSKWSSIVNIEFPSEFLKDVKILDIIEENNNDIETNRFNTIIREEGIPQHVEDKITDQDVTYFHKPENISSGFYTAERRIIPLKDKLNELDNLIQQIRSDIEGSSSELKVSIKHGETQYPLVSYEKVKIYVKAYNEFDFSDIEGDSLIDGDYTLTRESRLASTIMYISLLNDSNQTIKLHSLFPSSKYLALNSIKNSKYNIYDYCMIGTGSLEYGFCEDPTSPNVLSDANISSKQFGVFGGVWYECPEAQENSQRKYIPLTQMPGTVCGQNNINNQSVLRFEHESGYYGNYPGSWFTKPNDSVLSFMYQKLSPNNQINIKQLDTRVLNTKMSIQTGNQFLYFRVNDPITNEMYYEFGPGNTIVDNYDGSARQYNIGLKKGQSTTSSNSYNSLYARIKKDCKIINNGWDSSRNNVLSAGFFECGLDKFINGRRVESNDSYLISPYPFTDITDANKYRFWPGTLDHVTEYLGHSMNMVNDSAMIKHTPFKEFNGTPNPVQNITTPTMYVYPSLTKEFGLCIDSLTDKRYLEIKSGDEILIPIKVEYCLPNEPSNNTGDWVTSIEKSMAFDILYSNYMEPSSYSFQIIAKKDLNESDKIYIETTSEASTSKYNVIYR